MLLKGLKPTPLQSGNLGHVIRARVEIATDLGARKGYVRESKIEYVPYAVYRLPRDPNEIYVRRSSLGRQGRPLMKWYCARFEHIMAAVKIAPHDYVR